MGLPLRALSATALLSLAGLVACIDLDGDNAGGPDDPRLIVGEVDRAFYSSSPYRVEDYLDDPPEVTWEWDDCEDSSSGSGSVGSGYGDASSSDAGYAAADAGSWYDAGTTSAPDSGPRRDAGSHGSDASRPDASYSYDAGATAADGSCIGEASYPVDAGSPCYDCDAGPPPDAAPVEPDAGDALDAGAEPERAWFQLSPDDSTSMASAQLLKTEGSWYGFDLKPHEVVNYYDPPAALRQAESFAARFMLERGIVVGLDAVSGPSQSAPGEVDLELLVHLYAPTHAPERRRPWNLHLCVDVSGSMSGDKICQVRNALRGLIEHLRPGDRISLTTFDDVSDSVLATQEFAENEAAIRAAVDQLGPHGSTNMIAGLTEAYRQAQAAYTPAAINRVLVFSDGQANVGDTDVASFAALTRINDQEGIYLSGVGVGADYAVERMDALTDAGKGAHVFLPDDVEVRTIFGRMLNKLVDVAADQISIEVELPPGFALDVESFTGEEVSTDPDHRVQNVVLAAGDDMTLLATFTTDDPEELDEDLLFVLRYRPLTTGEPAVFEHRVPIRELVRAPGQLMQRTRLVDAYGRWATGEAPEIDPVGLRQQLQTFAGEDPGLGEIAEMISRLSGREP